MVGARFAVAAVAAGAQCPVEEVEAACEALAAQQHVLEDMGLRAWPDGTSSGRYRFGHALYRQVLYEGLGSARRREVHRRIGLRLEAGYGAQVGAVAARLAVHFERGGEVPRAVHYWQQTGDNAAQRNAHYDAVAAFGKGWRYWRRYRRVPSGLSTNSRCSSPWGSRWAAQGYRAEVGEVYSRAHTLSQQVGEPPNASRRSRASAVSSTRAQVRPADALSQERFHLARHQPDPVLMLEGLRLEFIAFYRGDRSRPGPTWTQPAPRDPPQPPPPSPAGV